MLHFKASFARRVAAISILGGLVAGCSNAGMPSTTTAASDARSVANGFGVRTSAAQARIGGWMSPDAKKKKKTLIYWGDYNNSTITIYSAKGTNGKELGQITTGLSNPERLFVDKQGSVYATNIGNSTITAYKPGTTSPFLTISNGVNRPTGLTVDGAGNVYCANVGNNTITVYPKGSTSASESLSASSPEYLATDANDNLYAAVAGGIEEWGPGSSNGTMLGLPSGSNGIEVDKSGNIIAIYGSQIEYFPAGQSQPSKEITVNGSPYALSLSGNEKQLYVSVESGSPFIIQNVAYPKGTTLSTKLSNNGGQWPFAVSPDNALGT